MSHKVRFLISLCLNLGLGFYYLFCLPSSEAGREHKKVVSPQAGGPNTQKTKQPSVVPNVIEKQRDWHSLESTDYQEYIRNLRAIHCPEITIQDIILAEIDEQFGPRLAKANEIPPEIEEGDQRAGPKGRKPNLEPLYAERAALIESLLGVKENVLRAQYDWHDAAIQSRFVFLKAETRERLVSLERKYGLSSPNTGYELSWSYVVNEGENKEMHHEMAGFMTEAEIAEYDLRASSHSAFMASDFESINVTEAEFRSVFPVYRRWYQARMSPAELEATHTDEEIKAVIKQAEAEMAALLSKPRYEEFRLWRDMSYESLFTAGTYLGYNPKVAKDVIKMRANVLKTVEAVRKDGDLQGDERAIKLKEIRRVTEKEIQRLIGERGLNYYLMDGHGGRWVDSIAPDGIKR